MEHNGNERPVDSIDWNGEKLEIQLALELPFWMLVPDNRYQVELDGLTISIETVAQGISVQSDTLQSRTHARCRFFGRIPGEGSRGPFSAFDLVQGANFRWTRTQCWITTSAVKDAFAALDDELPRSAMARQYFATLAMGHIPFINKLINAYRCAAGDPFAEEITEFDVPLWFLVVPTVLRPIYLFPALCRDEYPTLHTQMGKEDEEPYFATSPEDLIRAFSFASVPGEVELRDAWSRCYRGRFGEAIRSAVTAIEVLLETKLQEILTAKGLSPEEVEERLKKTKNRFPTRLDDYCRESGRAIPGPTLHYIPYLNGLRLREQFEITRELRHDVVHRGKRLDPSLRNPMRRALETTTWLFDWLANDKPNGNRQTANYTYFEAQRGMTTLRWEISQDGVQVKPLFTDEVVDVDEEPSCLSEMPEARIVRSIDFGDIPDAVFHATLNRFPDIEHFVLMALAKLGFEKVDDVFQDPEGSGVTPRWHAVLQETEVSVFLFESEESITAEDFRIYSEAMKAASAEQFLLVVVHDQKAVEWTTRSTEGSDSDISGSASKAGIGVVRSHDLARFASAAWSNKWAGADISEELLKPGWGRLPPINVKEVGKVRRYFPQRNVISIELNGQIDVSIDDLLWVRLRNELRQFPIRSMQQEHNPVTTARNGCIGVEVELPRNDVVAEGDVFLDMRAKAPPTDISGASAVQQFLGGFRGGY
jgi:hypothetical protein